MLSLTQVVSHVFSVQLYRVTWRKGNCSVVACIYECLHKALMPQFWNWDGTFVLLSCLLKRDTRNSNRYFITSLR